MAKAAFDTEKLDLTGFPPGGYSLSEAIKEFSAPDDWEAFERAAAKASGLRRSGFFCDSRGEPIAGWDAYFEGKRDNALIDERERAWERVLNPFLTGLIDETWVVIGVPSPLGPDSIGRLIPSFQWQVLRPDFEQSYAQGGGAEYYFIRVYRPEELDPSRMEHPVSDCRSFEPVVPKERRKPGRPGYRDQIIAEMKRRAARGEFCNSIAAEADYLFDWAQRDPHCPNPRSKGWIKKLIAEEYRNLSERKKAE